MPAPAASPTRLTRHRSFMLFWCARTFTNGAYMMQGVAVGWQIYDLTHDPFDLGLVGLVQFVPLLALSVLIGQVADRYDRRAVAATCQVAKALAALALAAGTAAGSISRDAMLAILFVSATARAFEMPSIHALLPGVVPVMLLPRAIAASASAQQTAVICGPSLGGFLYALGPATVYLACTAIFIAASVLISLVRIAPRREEARKPISIETLFAGFRYIRGRPILLGAISLDLFAVLLGGVTVLAHRAIDRGAGRIMFAAVGTFGLASFLFGLSTSIELSFLALVIYGASDAVSVVIRQSLVQMRTPYDMLGRVMAVNSMFTGSSGALGEFRAGTIAALIGAVPSALIGGGGAIAAMLVWMWAFPQLRRVDKLASEAGSRE